MDYQVQLPPVPQTPPEDGISRYSKAVSPPKQQELAGSSPGKLLAQPATAAELLGLSQHAPSAVADAKTAECKEQAQITSPRTGQTSKSAPTLTRGIKRRRDRAVKPTPCASSSTAALFKRQMHQRHGVRQAGVGLSPQEVKTRMYSDFSLQNAALSGCMSENRSSSRIAEVVSGFGLVFCMSSDGACTVFECSTLNRVAFIDERPHNVFRSIFLNELNESLVIVYVCAADSYTNLKCRSVPISDIKKGRFQGVTLFGEETLCYPGFVEFDTVNNVVLTLSATHKRYKTWDMKTYELLHTINNRTLEMVKLSPGIMMLVHSRRRSHMCMEFADVYTGKILTSLFVPLHRQKPIELVELFGDRLLIKQQDERLRLIDIMSPDKVESCKVDFPTPCSLIFLNSSQRFLTFKERQVTTWDVRGRVVARFDNHVLLPAGFSSHLSCVSRHQDMIISACRSTCRKGASIHFSDINTGCSLARIDVPASDSIASQALEDITAMCFNEEINELYTGDRNGQLHVWSNTTRDCSAPTHSHAVQEVHATSPVERRPLSPTGADIVSRLYQATEFS